MPKPKFTRVRLAESGAKVTVSRVRDGMTVVDEPATDRRGAPLPAEYPEPLPYKDQKVEDLKAEVDRRNATRDEDNQIVVAGKGNKPDLVAALEADDETTTTPAHTSAEELA